MTSLLWIHSCLIKGKSFFPWMISHLMYVHLPETCRNLTALVSMPWQSNLDKIPQYLLRDQEGMNGISRHTNSECNTIAAAKKKSTALMFWLVCWMVTTTLLFIENYHLLPAFLQVKEMTAFERKAPEVQGRYFCIDSVTSEKTHSSSFLYPVLCEYITSFPTWSSHHD